jgi:SAM-dependent methyltransferase
VLAGSERAGLAEMRAGLLADAAGATLEIGGGTGLNLAHYPPGVTGLTVIEPDPFMARRLRARAEDNSNPVAPEVIEASAEELPFPDGSFDTVVSTLVLCTVPDAAAAAAEVARVLRPDGRLLVLEHVRDDDDTRRARWQDRLERPWGWVAAGCHPNRDTAATLRAAGFDLEIEPGEFPKGGPVVQPVIRGIARKPAVPAAQPTEPISSA